MEKVNIPNLGNFKFILIKKSKGYIIFGDFLPYHSDLLEKFLQLNAGNFEVDGGGKMLVENGRIKVYGKSNNYGPFDRKIVKELMEKYCKECGLELDVE